MEYIDGAQIALYAFWFFFAGLLIYIRREDKREGYPLESGQGPRDGWPVTAGAKTFVHAPGMLAPATASETSGVASASMGGDTIVQTVIAETIVTDVGVVETIVVVEEEIDPMPPARPPFTDDFDPQGGNGR